MKRFALSLAVLGMLAVFNAPASASDLSVFLRGGNSGGYHAPQYNQGRHHQNVHHGSHYGHASQHQAYRQPNSYRDPYAYRSASRVPTYPHHHGGSSYGYGGSSRGFGNSYGYGTSFGNGYSSSRYRSSCAPQSGFSFSLGF